MLRVWPCTPVCRVCLGAQIFAVIPLRGLINVDPMPAEPTAFDRLYVLAIALIGGTLPLLPVPLVRAVVALSQPAPLPGRVTVPFVTACPLHLGPHHPAAPVVC
jgi:hypothetical protein